MIFGPEEPKPAHISTDLVRVRPLEADEIRSLSVDQLIYVQDTEFVSPILVPAHVQSGGNTAYTDSSTPSLPVQSIYGSQFWVRFDKVFMADDLGEEMPVQRTVGSRVSGTFFFLGVEEDEVVERLKKALRNEFGTGVVEVWNLRSGPVRDMRWDVWETRTAWIPYEGSPRGKNQKGSYEIVERKLLARGVRDGNQHHFMGKQRDGWNLLVETHQPGTSQIEVL